MAKKHSRSTKNRNRNKSQPVRSSGEPGTPDSSASQSENRVADGFQDAPAFWLSLVFLVGVSVYLVWFLVCETAIGHRFVYLLSFMLQPEIFKAYWTGSPSGQFSLLDRFPLIAGLIVHLTIALGIGLLAIRLLSTDFRGLELFLVAIATGLALLSTGTLLLGLLGVYAWKQVCVIPPILLAISGFAIHFRNKRSKEKNESTEEARTAAWPDHLWLFSIPFVAIILLGSMLPPWEFDVREYHLQVPREWFQQGFVGFLSHNVYGNMPLGTEMHALFAMLYSFGAEDWWWGALIGKTISGSFAILGGMTSYLIASRLFGRFAGSIALVVHLSTPWVIANSIVGYNESALGFYLLMTIHLLLRLSDSYPAKDRVNENAPQLFPGTMLLGCFVGGAISIKYTAVPFVAIPAMAMLLLIGKRRGFPVARILGWSCLGMLLVGGPWYIKNLILTGNPTYPLLGSVFPSNRTEKQNQQWSAAHRPPADRSAIEDAWKHAGLLAGLYKWASPLLVPFLALSLLCKRRFCWWLLGFLGYCFLLWLLVTHRLERFLLPFYPVAAILAGSSVVWQQGPFWQRMVAAVLLVGVLINLPFAASRLVGDVRFFAPLKDLDGRSTTARDYEHPDGAILPLNHLSPKMAWLNENHPDSKVLFFGECRPLTAEFPVIYNTCFDQCETWKRVHGRSPREIRDLFAREEIEFLLVNFSEWTRMKQTYGYNVEDEGKPIEPGDILALDGKAWRRMKDLDEKFPGNPSVWVFRLLPPQDTGRPDAFSGQPAESP